MKLKINTVVVLVLLLASSNIAKEIKLNSELTLERYLTSSKKDFEGSEDMAIIANPSGTRLVVTSQKYSGQGGGGGNSMTEMTAMSTIKIEGVEAPGSIPPSNYQTTLNNDISNIPAGYGGGGMSDTVYAAVFVTDTELAVEFTSATGTGPYLNILEIQGQSLAVSKKNPPISFSYGMSYTQSSVTYDYKDGMVVIGGKNFMIIKAENLLGSMMFSESQGGMSMDTFYSLNFDKRPESSYILASLDTGFTLYDYSLGVGDEEPVEMEVYKSEDLTLGFTDIEQNHLDMTKALVALELVQQVRLLQSKNRRRIIQNQQEEIKGLLMYYDLQDPYSYGLRLLAMTPDTMNEFETKTNCLKNIIESNFFIALVSPPSNGMETSKYLYLTDTSVASLSLGAVMDLPTFRINSAVTNFLPTDVKSAQITSFTRLIQGENKFAFSIIHGEDGGNQPGEKKGTFIVLDFKKNCHESCMTCYQVFNQESCLTCREGYELKSTGALGDGRPTGSCDLIQQEQQEGPDQQEEEQGQQEEEEEESSNEGNEEQQDDEISLRFPLTAMCGGNQIKGCVRCSNFHTGKCATCQNQLGLAHYTEDFGAGEKCVDCPVSGCMKCEMSLGDPERRCTRCLGDKALIQLSNGNQLCHKEIYGVLFGLLSLVVLTNF